ncbi:MAG: flippase-like domain-containing protein [Proteobacteria bacterium]|nr:flippase-like domain-containing protein [Pseudomonadota bacterium]
MVKKLIRYVVTFGLLGFLLSKLDFAALMQATAELNFAAYMVSAVIWFFALAIRAKRWQLFLPEFEFCDLYRLTLVSVYYSSVFAGPIAGDGVKTYRLIQRNREQSQVIAASVALENLAYYTAAPLSGLIGLFFVEPPYKSEIAVGLSGAFVLFLGFIFVGQYLRIKAIDNSLQGWLSKAVQFLSEFSKTYSDFSRQKKKIFWSISWGVPFHFLCAAVNYVVFAGLGFEVSFLDFCWINAVMAMVLFFPVTVGGFGLREGGMVLLLGLVGLDANSAIAGVLVVFSIQIIGAVIGFLIDYSSVKHYSAREFL